MKAKQYHSVKIVRIRSYSGPHSVRMRENKDQNNSKHGHFLRSIDLSKKIIWANILDELLRLCKYRISKYVHTVIVQVSTKLR